MEEDYFRAIKEGELEKIEQMIERNPNLVNLKDESGMSGVVIATYYAQPKIAALLVLKGANLNFFEAAMVGDLPSLKRIIKQDKSLVNSYSRDGFTALHLAAFFGHLDAVRFLIEVDANVDAVARNLMKVTPLHSAAAHNQVEISEILISNKADVNARQENNYTPLHAAAQNGNVALARLLLKHGALANALTSDGKTPLDLTREGGPESGRKEDREEVAKILAREMAK